MYVGRVKNERCKRQEFTLEGSRIYVFHLQTLQTLVIRPMGVQDSGAASVAAALARRGAAAPHGGNPWPTVDAGIHDANDDNDDSEVMMPRMLMMILMIMMKSVSDSP